MSKELLEFSVLVDEKFEINFGPLSGLIGFILRFL